MPVTLPREVWLRWLSEEDAGAGELLALLHPYPAELMRAYPVGQRVGNVRNNDPALLDRLDQAILARAFRGELVPRAPNDEPASALLERVRSSRVARIKSQVRRGRSTQRFENAIQ